MKPVSALPDVELVVEQVEASSPVEASIPILYPSSSNAIISYPVPPPSQGLTTISVVCPASLPEGYEFPVEVPGRGIFTVVVPPGGVVAGQSFIATVLDSPPLPSPAPGSGSIVIARKQQQAASNRESIPEGRWRTGLCDCFDFGLCHPSVCLTCWCRSLALGQVMTRMKLTMCGRAVLETNSSRQQISLKSAFKAMAILFMAYLLLEIIVLSIASANVSSSSYYDCDYTYDPYYGSSYSSCTYSTESTPGWVSFLFFLFCIIGFSYAIFILVATCRTRAYIRHKHQIPEIACIGCEDCCCSYWCNCCTVAQMLQHTANYSQHQATCCTSTGLDVFDV